MVSENEIQKSKTIADKTMARLEKEGLAPTPETYSLWYNYYAGSDASVIRAIDVHEKTQKTFSEKDCSELYRNHILDLKSEEVMKKAEATIFTVLHDVLGIIGEVEGATGTYEASLKESSQDLTKVKSIDDLKKVMTAMVSDTKKMREKNKNLEKELSTSTSLMKNLRKEVETVKQEANTDGLTGIMNRKAFDKTLAGKIRENSQENRAMSLLMLDIDHFKKFNDTYGHQVGDQVLKLVARTLIESIKGKDTAARYGGEEFSIILPETNLTAAVAVANGLRRAVANKELVNKNTGDVLGRITISIGAAEAVRFESPSDLIERADKALYSAKQKGRDQVCAAGKPGETSAAE